MIVITISHSLTCAVQALVMAHDILRKSWPSRPGPMLRWDRMPCKTSGCLINYSQPMTASSTLAVQSNHLQGRAWSKAGTKVCLNATALIPRSCSSSCYVLVSCLASTVGTRLLTVRTYDANDQDVEMEIQTCWRIRVSSVACHHGQEFRTYRDRWLDCRFGLVSGVAIVVDKGKSSGTGVS
jgi:hypothetical protein